MIAFGTTGHRLATLTHIQERPGPNFPRILVRPLHLAAQPTSVAILAAMERMSQVTLGESDVDSTGCEGKNHSNVRIQRTELHV